MGETRRSEFYPSSGRTEIDIILIIVRDADWDSGTARTKDALPVASEQKGRQDKPAQLADLKGKCPENPEHRGKGLDSRTGKPGLPVTNEQI